MRFYFLGTSSGMPTRRRNVSALLFSFSQEKKNYLFDCGEGTQHRLFSSPFSIAKISDIFISHLHGDHFYGILGLLSSRSLLGIRSSLNIFGPKGIKSFIEDSFKLSSCQLKYELNIVEFKNGMVLKNTERFSLKVLEVSHNIATYAFFIEEKKDHYRFDVEKAKKHESLPIRFYSLLANGENISYKGIDFAAKDFRSFYSERRKLIICSDNSNPEVLSDYCMGISLLIHEATHTEEVKKSLSFKSFHSTGKEVAEFAERLAIKNLLLHHFSPRFTFSKKEKTNIYLLKKEAETFYKGNLFMAEDFTEFHLLKNGLMVKG